MEKTFKVKNNAPSFWAGFSKQTIDFQHALAELIDNAISATLPKKVGDGKETAVIEVTIKENNDNSIIVQVADAGTGVSLNHLSTDENNIFNIGYEPPNRGYMNEHGFGLKNALALMTSGFQKSFYFLSRPHGTDIIHRIDGPIKDEMELKNSDQETWNEDLDVLKDVQSGVKVNVQVKREYFNSLYIRGQNFDTLATRLGEHLGVMYAHYIDSGHEVYFCYKPKDSISWIKHKIPSIRTPFLKNSQINTEENNLIIEVNGKSYLASYTHGRLDSSLVKESSKGWPYPLKIHFQGSNARCGVTIVVRNRVLKTGVFRDIWPTKTGDVSFNNFIAELKLGSDFQTTNNKHDLDPHSEVWQSLLNKLQEDFEPEKTTKKTSEEGLRKKLIETYSTVFNLIGSKKPKHEPVWGDGAQIDIFFEKDNKAYLIETKVEKAKVIDVYQLEMYWDGLVEKGKHPEEAILVAEDFPPNVSDAVEKIKNKKDSKGKNYNIVLKKIKSFG